MTEPYILGRDWEGPSWFVYLQVNPFGDFKRFPSNCILDLKLCETLVPYIPFANHLYISSQFLCNTRTHQSSRAESGGGYQQQRHSEASLVEDECALERWGPSQCGRNAWPDTPQWGLGVIGFWGPSNLWLLSQAFGYVDRLPGDSFWCKDKQKLIRR